MNGGVNNKLTSQLDGYIHINPILGKIKFDHLSPVVVMKKIKLGPSDASGFASVTNLTNFLPELTDADETEDVESQIVRREEPVQNEEVPFIHTLTQDELNDHVQRCLEMSSENKINLKNAFALQLIDCFSFLQEKKDFSAMACTLDAGTKIYSCRVDALHQQVVKLADEVVLNVKERRTKKEDEDGGQRLTKEQKTKRKGKFISSAETLNRKMKAKDPKDKYLKFEALPGAILSGARRDAKDLSLSLERYTPFWPNWENYKPLKADGVVPLPDIKIYREKLQTEISEIPQNFTDPDQLQTHMEHSFHGDDEPGDTLEITSSLDEFVSIVDTPLGELYSGNSGDNHCAPDDVADNASMTSRSGENEADIVLTTMGRLQEEAKAQGVFSKAPTRTEVLKVLFDVSSEYDYLKMKNCNYWAGPGFWKRPLGRTMEKEKGKEKRQIPNKKNEPAEIVYDFLDLDDRLLKLSKKVTNLSERTVRSWTNKKTTLPQDMKIDLSCFINLFHMENTGTTLQESNHQQKSTNFVDVIETFKDPEETTDNSTDPFSFGHEDMSSSQEDPLNATFYEAEFRQSENSEPRDPLNSTFYDAGPLNKEPGHIIRVEVSSSANSDFGESSMVPVPKMIHVDPIKYSTRPIRVDMQHLKHVMLTVIREEINKDAREKEIQRALDDLLPESKPEVKFRDVLKALPRKLDRRTREDLSTAIAFTAVLSLANENSLQFEKQEDGDFVVRFPDFPAPDEDSGAENRFKLPRAT